MTADNIFLQAFEVVLAGADSRFAKHLGRLLERSCGDEAIGSQRRTGDALKHQTGGGRFGFAHDDHLLSLTLQRGILVAQVAGRNDVTDDVALGIARIQDVILAVDFVVGIHEGPLVDEFLGQEFGIARIGNLHLAHHLAHDNLEMLVVDLHTLQTINRLDLVHDVFLGLYRTENTENVGRGDTAVGQPGTGLDVVVLLNQDLLGQRN